MKRVKTYLVRTFAAAMVVALVMINIQVDIESPYSMDNITITVNEVQAGPTYDDMELADKTCWITGREILICVSGEYRCDASDQGTCGGST